MIRDGFSPFDGTRLASGVVFTVVCLLATACGDANRTTPRGSSGGAITSGEPVCSTGPASPGGGVTPEIETIGPTSNAIRPGGDYLWIVESGSNTVSRYSPQTGRLERNFIDVGNGHNPFDIAVDPEASKAYVTNYLADSITVADTETGRVLREVEAEPLDKPEGVAVVGDHLYVSNVHYTGGEEPFDAGSVVVFERESMEVVGRAETERKNPQFVRPVETPQGRRVAIVSSGVIDFAEGGRAVATSPGGLELWPTDGRTERSAREIYPMQRVDDGRHGAPGRPLPTPDGGHLYFTSATSGELFTFDLEAREWTRGTRDPLQLHDAGGNALHHGAMGPRGILYATAFNDDALYLWDTSCDAKLAGPIDIGTTPSLLEGPHGIAVERRRNRTRLFFITSRAHTLGRVTLDF
jgi:YVTN family beta-propeller protein